MLGPGKRDIEASSTPSPLPLVHAPPASATHVEPDPATVSVGGEDAPRGPPAAPERRDDEVPRHPTPLSELDLARVLLEAHRHSFGAEPSGPRLASAWAHVALETGRGRYLECHNIGNLTIRTETHVDYFVRRFSGRATPWSNLRPVDVRFRAYTSSMEGAIGYWRQLALHYGKALSLFDAGAAGLGALNLAENGYATAPAVPYAAAIESLYEEYLVRIEPMLSRRATKP